LSHIRSFLIGTFGLLSTVASANTGTINVDISTAPGEIELDGFPTGQTAPAIIDSVSPGDHLIELEYGCMVGSTTVTVYRDQEATADIHLENRGGEGTVRLRGLPRSAAVFFDEAPLEGIDRGVQVACGGHRVRVEASGFQDWESMVVVTTGRWVTLEVSMVEGQIEESVRPAPIAYEEDSSDWDDEDGWDDDDSWDEPAGPSRAELARAERERFEEEERRAAAEAERARREEEVRRAAEAEVRRLEEEAARARAELERETYGDIDSLDDPDDGEYLEEDLYDEEELEGGIYEEDYDDEFDDEDSWDDEYRGYSDSGDDLDDDFGESRSIRDGSDSGNTAMLAGISTIAGIGGIGFGTYSLLSYQDSRLKWIDVANQYGHTSPEAVSFWDQNVDPKYKLGLVSLAAGGILTATGGGLFIFRVMGDDGGFFGVNGEW